MADLSGLPALKGRYAQLIADAKAKAAPYAGKEHEMPANIFEEIHKLLGDSDVVKTQIDTLMRFDQVQKTLENGGVPAAAGNWRESGAGEGLPGVDHRSWRETEVKTVFGTQKLRYFVPEAISAKGYPGAFESYIRKGMGEMGPNDKKTLSVGVDTAGGFWVPEDFHLVMIQKLAGLTAIRSNAMVVTTSRDVGSWPRINYTTDNRYTSGVRLTWTGETPASSTVHRVTDPVAGLLNVPVFTAMASMPITNQLLEDSAFDVMGIGSDKMSESFALGEDDAFVNGTGASRPKGLLLSPSASDTMDEIKFILSGAAGSIGTTGDPLIDLFYDVPAQYRNQRGKWYMNSQTMKAVEKLKDGQSRYLVQSLINGSLASLGFDTIKGKAVAVDEFFPDIGAANFPIVFGDMQGYMVLDRVGFSLQRLSELYAETDITVLLARKRVGGQLVEPWRLRALKSNNA